MNAIFMKWIIAFGLAEGTSTLVLFFVAMPLKYYAGMPMAVSIAGGIHGVLFVVLVGLFVLGRKFVPFSTGVMWTGIIGAIIPFGPFVVDVKLLRMLAADRNSHP